MLHSGGAESDFRSKTFRMSMPTPARAAVPCDHQEVVLEYSLKPRIVPSVVWVSASMTKSLRLRSLETFRRLPPLLQRKSPAFQKAPA